MTGNRSLDEFSTGSADDLDANDSTDATISAATEPPTQTETDDTDIDSSADGAATEGSHPDNQTGRDGEPSTESESTTAIAVTYDWRAHGGTCVTCQEIVSHRWQDEDGLVCSNCKSW